MEYSLQNKLIMKTILVPTDFSTCSKAAIKYAIQFNTVCQCRIIFFHSTFTLIPTSLPEENYFDTVDKELYQKKEKLVKFICAEYIKAGIVPDDKQISYLIKFGNSFWDNLETSLKENKIDLIIMGTHGASGIEKFLFGSNTVKTIKNSLVPVLVIPNKYIWKGISRVNWAVENITSAFAHSKLVKNIFRKFQPQFELFHLQKKSETLSDPELNKCFKSIQKVLPATSYNTIKLDQKNLIETLNDYLKKSKPNVFIMLTHKRSALENLYNKSKTADISYKIKIPLLSINEG